MFKNKINLAFVYLLLIMFGCATGLQEVEIDTDYDMDKNPNKSIIFGKIDVKAKGVIGIQTHRMFLLNRISTGKPIATIATPSFSNDDYFFLALDPGEYRIDAIGLNYGLAGPIGALLLVPDASIPVYMGFSVDPNEVIYIGKLVIECTLKSGFSHLELADKKVIISDEFNSAVEEFRKQYPNIKKDIKKNLVR